MLIAVIVIAALVLIAAGIVFWAYRKTFASPPRDSSETEMPLAIANKDYHDEIQQRAVELAAVPCEFFETRAYDGVKLSARYYHRADGAPLAICFHGYRGSAVRDFSMMGPFLMELGYNVILVDQRAHWRSGSHTITFGIKERRDVLSWVNFANERFGRGTPIYLFGISLGGGTVLMASGQPLPDNVRAICADCPFNCPKDIICHVSRKVGISPKWGWPIVWLAARTYGHFNINETTAADEVRRTKKPILIIHGEGDNFVPMYMSEQVRDANPETVEYHSFPKAGHGLSYMYDTPRYKRIVEEFLKKH